MAFLYSFWIFSLTLLLLASPLLQVAMSMCQSHSDEAVKTTEEAGDFGDATFTSAQGIDTISVFPKNTKCECVLRYRYEHDAVVITAGEETELLVGVKNNGESSLNVVAIKATLHRLVENRMLVQNLTAQVFHKGSVPASAQATFPYIFAVGKFLKPGNFDLVGNIMYEINGQPYQSTFYNGTIEVVDLKSVSFPSAELVFLISLDVVALVIFGPGILSLIQHLYKKTKRAPKVEVGTWSTKFPTNECLKGTAFAQSQSNESKKKK